MIKQLSWVIVATMSILKLNKGAKMKSILDYQYTEKVYKIGKYKTKTLKSWSYQNHEHNERAIQARKEGI